MSLRIGLIRVGRCSLYPRIPREDHALAVFKYAHRHPVKCVARSLASTSNEPQVYAQNLQAALRSKDLPRVHHSYAALADTVKRAHKDGSHALISSYFKPENLALLLETLGRAGRAFDLTLIETILADMPVVFGINPTEELHTSIIRGLLASGSRKAVQTWLTALPQKPGHFTPTLRQWHILLQECYLRDDVDMLRHSMTAMRRSGCNPTNASYKFLIRALFKDDPKPHVFHEILEDMRRLHLPYDASIAALLFDGLKERGLLTYATDVKAMYCSHFKDLAPIVDAGSDWNDVLSQTVHAHGLHSALKLVRLFREEGFQPTLHTFTVLLGNSANLGDLRNIERELDLAAGVNHWSSVINANVRAGKLSVALAIYDEALESGIQPDAPMAHPLISALCRSSFRPPTDNAVDRALSIYRDIMRTVSEGDNHSRTSTHSGAGGPDAAIYNSLLRGLSASPNVHKYFPVATSLVDEMKTRNITINDNLTTTSLTVLLMRSASSFKEAFGMYQRMVQDVGGRAIGAKGYAVILNAFTQLPFGTPPPVDYFQIVKDMKTAGYPVTVEVYTILLRELAKHATRVVKTKPFDAEEHKDIVLAIKRAHTQLKIDPSVSPDTVLWNQLMDAYQRAGCFHEADQLWDLLFVSGTFDYASVSIILDACSFSRSWERAVAIWTKLQATGFICNLHNWNSWLECLSRMGKLDEAARVACLDMGNQRGRVKPNVESARILLKYATNTNQQNEIRARLKRYLPRLWDSLPQELKGCV
ncbi:hypothetical protein PLICRDRAFT_415780 [Plicaturopsis crispa FD-325 SS-3]|nr:hypothetical protein PLICRDRAFT_415780 [Plicaturopsis crispa FD-325 SS-3]